MYAAHWFEGVDFDPDPEWSEGTTEEELLQIAVIGSLKHGVKHLPRLNARRIEDNYIQAYIIHPAQGYDEIEGGYHDKLQRIQTTVCDIIPMLRSENLWQWVGYNASQEIDPESPRETAGRNIFKYDPGHPIRRGKTQKWAMLWA